MNTRRVSRRDAMRAGTVLAAAALGGVGGSEAQEARSRPSYFAAGAPEGALLFEVGKGGRAAFSAPISLPPFEGEVGYRVLCSGADDGARASLSLRVQYGDLTGALAPLNEYDGSLLGVGRALDPLSVAVVLSVRGYPTLCRGPLRQVLAQVELGLISDGGAVSHVGRTQVVDTVVYGAFVGSNVALSLGPILAPLPTPPLRGYVVTEAHRIR